MKNTLRKLCQPILSPFEQGNEAYHYKPLNRKILIIIATIFSFLASLVCVLIPQDADPGYYIPVIVFGSLGVVGLVVGFLGTDRAVAKIWNNK
jgi:peptidoglycan/LPS O-acetylase OafA/YrhL